MQRTRLNTVFQEPENKQKENQKDKDKDKDAEENKDDKEKEKDKDKDKVQNENYEDIPQLITIDQIKKPIISKQRKQDLKEKLQLQKESLAKVRDRQKTNKLILSYDRNLFMQQSRTPIQKDERDIVNQILNLQNSSVFQDFQETRKRFRQQMGYQIMTFQKIKSSIGKNKIKLRDQPEVEKEKQNKQIIQQKRQNSQLDNLPKTAMQIYKMSEQNIYLKKQKGLNIFREAKNALKSNDIKENYLEQSHFIEKSVSESYNMTTIKIDTFKHLSKFARLLAANKEENIKPGSKLDRLKQKPQDYLYDIDVTYDLNNLNYRTLMNIASGRFTSSFFATAQLGIEDVPSVTPDEKKELSLSERSQINPGIEQDDNYKNEGWETQTGNMDQFYRDCMIKAPLLDTQKKAKALYKKLLKEIEYDNKKKQQDLIRRIYQKQEQTQERSITMDRLQSFRGNRYSYKEIKKIYEENKKTKTKEDQFWLESFQKALKLQIQTADQLEKIRKDSIFY